MGAVGTLSLDALQRKMDRWARRQERDARAALKRSGEVVKKQAQEKHLSGPKMPVGQSDTKDPRIDSKGPLRNSLRVKVTAKSGKVNAEVQARHGLARIHHDGGTEYARGGKKFVFEIQGRTVVTDRVKMPKRPFLAAALTAKQKDVTQILSEAMIKGYEAAG